MRRPVLLSFAVLLFVTGCTGSRGQEATLRGENEALQRRVETLQTEKAELEEQLRVMRDQEAERAKQPAEGQTPQPVPFIPKYVCAGLAEHLYLELSRGNKPLEMLDATVQVGFSAEGYPRVEDVPPAEVDFGPAVQWVKENPITLVHAVHLPLSQPGYQRVDLDLTNGFYVSVICQQYRITRFLILDHEPGQT